MAFPIHFSAPLLALVAAACASTPADRIVQPAHAVCQSLPKELVPERDAWLAPGAALSGGRNAVSARSVVTLVRTKIKLVPQASLEPVALAKPEANPPGSYGALMAFAPGRGGVFRVSVSERTWIELIDRASGVPLAPISSDKRPRCFGVPKALLFELAPQRDYLLQITASSGSELDVLIAQAAK